MGGAVRDLLLGRAIADIDLAVQGEAIALVGSSSAGASVTTHARFGTASLALPSVRIDVASTRTETYAQPGALPQVAPATIENDLRRRDFSMNALAVRLTGEAALLDPCAGAADIAAGRIRVLHDRSFEDDATRIFRALRYAARLGFALEGHTAALARDGVPFIATVGGERVRRELELIMRERTGGLALEAAQATGALRGVHPALQWDAGTSLALSAATGVDAGSPFGFALLASQVEPADAVAICERLRLTHAEAEAVRGIAALAAAPAMTAMLRRPEAKPSGIVTLLDRFPTTSVAAFVATAADAIARQMAARYLDDWRHVRPLLSGSDLQELGVPEGPQVGKGLQLIRAARLDGWASDHGDERALALRFAKSIRDAAGSPAGREVQHDDD